MRDNEYITIKRVGENGITVDYHATKAHIAPSIIALFEELTKINFTGAVLLILGLIDIIEEKKEE